MGDTRCCLNAKNHQVLDFLNEERKILPVPAGVKVGWLWPARLPLPRRLPSIACGALVFSVPTKPMAARATGWSSHLPGAPATRIHGEIPLVRMVLRCSINSVLPTTSAYVYVLCDVCTKSNETPFKNPYTGASAASVSGSLQNGSIESDAAV